MKSSVPLLLLLAACEREAPPGPAPTTEPGPPPGPRVHQLDADSDPGQVDDTLIAHIQAQRWEPAYELMSAAYRRGVSLQRFERAVSANEYLRTTTIIGCSHIETFELGVQRRECILQSEAGNAFAQLYYARDPEGWRMTGMVIGGTPAFPSPETVGHVPSSPIPTPSSIGSEVLDPWR